MKNSLIVVLIAFVLVIISCYIYYNNPVSYVSIDINPSIMLTINRFDRVIKVEGLNEDAKKLIENIKLYGVDIVLATEKITNKAVELGYLDKNLNDNVVLVSAYCNNEEKRENLQQKFHDNLNKKGIRSFIVDTELTEEDAKKSNEYGVSEAKILFVKKAIEQNPELKFEDLIYLPAREIAKYIDGYENLNINNNGNQNSNQGHNNQNANHGNNKKSI